MARLQQAQKPAQVFIVNDRDQAEEEEDVVTGRKHYHVALDRSAAVDVDDREKYVVQNDVWLPWKCLSSAAFDLVVCVKGPCSEVAEHEKGTIAEAGQENLKEVLHWYLLDQVESILSEDAMKDIVAVVSVRNALQHVLDGCLNCHEEGEE